MAEEKADLVPFWDQLEQMLHDRVKELIKEKQAVLEHIESVKNAHLQPIQQVLETINTLEVRLTRIDAEIDLIDLINMVRTGTVVRADLQPTQD